MPEPQYVNKKGRAVSDPTFLNQLLDSYCGYQTFFCRAWAALNFWNQVLSSPMGQHRCLPLL